MSGVKSLIPIIQLVGAHLVESAFGVFFLGGVRLFVQQIPGTVFFVDDVGCMITPEFVLHLATLIDVSER